MAELVALQENQKIKEFQQKLSELRSDGVNKIVEIKQTAAKVKKNPMRCLHGILYCARISALRMY